MINYPLLFSLAVATARRHFFNVLSPYSRLHLWFWTSISEIKVWTMWKSKYRCFSFEKLLLEISHSRVRHLHLFTPPSGCVHLGPLFFLPRLRIFNYWDLYTIKKWFKWTLFCILHTIAVTKNFLSYWSPLKGIQKDESGRSGVVLLPASKGLQSFLSASTIPHLKPGLEEGNRNAKGLEGIQKCKK